MREHVGPLFASTGLNWLDRSAWMEAHSPERFLVAYHFQVLFEWIARHQWSSTTVFH